LKSIRVISAGAAIYPKNGKSMPPLIEIKNLSKYFKVGAGMLHAVDNVSFAIEKGRTLGVVGESGCGKSTLGRTIIRLQEATQGQILLDGEDITHVSGKKLKEVRKKVQIVFQDPYSSLNPRMRIEETIKEPLKNSGGYSRSQIKERASTLMDLVGIDIRLRQSYPHELDGGRRQRVGIARALALNPEFIVCDEPVSSLDVSIQAQVLNLLMDLQDQMGVTYMFVTHDLSVVRHISHRICVMYLGEVVEMCPSKELFVNNLHPYTKALLSAIPSLDITKPMRPIPLKGELTSPINPKPGCRFSPRCPYAKEICSNQPQTLEEVSPHHYVACVRVREINN
jgi:oligopeptide/dipeptide ABC transporter ATP-binding protein